MTLHSITESRMNHHPSPSPQADGHVDRPTTLTMHLAQELVREGLTNATIAFRGDGLPLSRDEQAHVDRWTERVIAFMSQEKLRVAATVAGVTVEAAILGVAKEVKDNEDHSAKAVIAQGVDAVARRILDLDLILQANAAIDVALGFRSYVEPAGTIPYARSIRFAEHARQAHDAGDLS